MTCACPHCHRVISWWRRLFGVAAPWRGWRCCWCGSTLRWENGRLVLAMLAAFLLFGVGLPAALGHRLAASLIALVGAACILLEQRPELAHGFGECRRCGYHLGDQADRCPECGFAKA